MKIVVLVAIFSFSKLFYKIFKKSRYLTKLLNESVLIKTKFSTRGVDRIWVVSPKEV